MADFLVGSEYNQITFENYAEPLEDRPVIRLWSREGLGGAELQVCINKSVGVSTDSSRKHLRLEIGGSNYTLSTQIKDYYSQESYNVFSTRRITLDDGYTGTLYLMNGDSYLETLCHVHYNT